MENKNNNLSLIRELEDKLRTEDMKVVSYIDLNKSDEEIIADMEAAGLLDFNKSEK